MSLVVGKLRHSSRKQCNQTYFVTDACVAFSSDTVFEENVAALTVCIGTATESWNNVPSAGSTNGSTYGDVYWLNR